MIFLRDPERFVRLDADSLRQSYKLSEAEVSLALVLDAGSSLRDVAREREVSITTVRSQLYSLMSKLGVRRQVDLARQQLLLNRFDEYTQAHTGQRRSGVGIALGANDGGIKG